MPTNFMEWLGVIGSITTVISFGMYLHERRKRRDHDNHMIGFLHGLKPIARARERGTLRTQSLRRVWRPVGS